MPAELQFTPDRPNETAICRRREQTSQRPPDHFVYVVDDDPRVREALGDLLASCGYNAQTFASAAEFFAAPQQSVAGCLILDVELPDINGLDLQKQLAGEAHPPIVFITGRGNISSSVCAMKAGAVDFLQKPFSEDQLLSAVNAALVHDRRAKAANIELDQLRAKYATLTPRERETFPLIVTGLRYKQAAAVLGISLVTMKTHRRNIVRKMRARSRSDLVRMSEKLQIP
jgi:FixJ family two-component response regulator